MFVTYLPRLFIFSAKVSLQHTVDGYFPNFVKCGVCSIRLRFWRRLLL